MKRRHGVMIWAAAVVPMLWFHATHGPTLLKRDAVASALRAGGAAEAAGDAASAVERYREAQNALPAADAGPDIALACATAMTRAQTHDQPVPDRVKAWGKLLKSAAADPAVRPDLLNDLRVTLAGLHYQSAYLMRRADAPPAFWRDEAELARQQFGYVAAADSDPSRAAAADNVERVYALERVGRATLMSRALTPKDETQAKVILQAKQSTMGDSDSTDSVLGSGVSQGGASEPKPQGGGMSARKKGS